MNELPPELQNLPDLLPKLRSPLEYRTFWAPGSLHVDIIEPYSIEPGGRPLRYRLLMAWQLDLTNRTTADITHLLPLIAQQHLAPVPAPAAWTLNLRKVAQARAIARILRRFGLATRTRWVLENTHPITEKDAR